METKYKQRWQWISRVDAGRAVEAVQRELDRLGGRSERLTPFQVNATFGSATRTWFLGSFEKTLPVRLTVGVVPAPDGGAQIDVEARAYGIEWTAGNRRYERFTATVVGALQSATLDTVPPTSVHH
jgi:hypothetical protein